MTTNGDIIYNGGGVHGDEPMYKGGHLVKATRGGCGLCARRNNGNCVIYLNYAPHQ